MLTLFLVVALAAPAPTWPATQRSTCTFVVAFASRTDPAHAARQLQLLQQAGLKDIRTVSSPLGKQRSVYRIVSLPFNTLAEARLALLEARRILAQAGIPFDGVVLEFDKAGRPMIR